MSYDITFCTNAACQRKDKCFRSFSSHTPKQKADLSSRWVSQSEFNCDSSDDSASCKYFILNTYSKEYKNEK